MLSPAELDAFYSDPSIEEWAAVLGPGMHYHFGYFLDPKGVLFEETLEEAQRRVVESFYPWIPEGARVLDIGCGWGGPAQMLIEDKGAEVLGLTISRAQAAYCREQGLAVEVLDVEQGSIPDGYDVAFMLEVLEHIRDKRGLLARLRSKVDVVAITVRCLHKDEAEDDQAVFGDSVKLSRVSTLHADLEAAGWRIQSQRDRARQAYPSYVHWKRNLDRVYGDTRPPGQLGVLRDLVNYAVQRGPIPSPLSPLLDIVAR